MPPVPPLHSLHSSLAVAVYGRRWHCLPLRDGPGCSPYSLLSKIHSNPLLHSVPKRLRFTDCIPQFPGPQKVRKEASGYLIPPTTSTQPTLTGFLTGRWMLSSDPRNPVPSPALLLMISSNDPCHQQPVGLHPPPQSKLHTYKSKQLLYELPSVIYPLNMPSVFCQDSD